MSDPELEKRFMESYHAHSDAIFRYCFFKLSDREKAVDAVQEVFMKTWNYIKKGNQITDFKGFIWKTAVNHVKDQWRKKKVLPMSAIESGDEDSEPFDIADERNVILPHAEYNLTVYKFRKLPDADRELLTLRFVEDLGVKEIAKMFDERENTIAVRINRALSRLRQHIL